MRRLFLALALLVTLGAPQAFALAVPLDDFTLAQSLFISLQAPAPALPTSTSSSVANDGSFLAGFDSREMFLYFNSANSTGINANVAGEVVPAENKFSYSSTDGEDGYAYLNYLNTTGDPIDISGYTDGFVFIIDNDVASSFKLLVSDGTNTKEVTQALPTSGNATYTFGLGLFSGTVDLTKVTQIRVYIDGIGAFNLDANVNAPPQETTPEPYTLTMLGLGAILLGRRLSKRS